MARNHFWSFIINEEGQPIEDAKIYLYLADTTIPATIYSQEVGGASFRSHSGTLINNDRILLSDETGFFEFWIDNSPSGYGSSQKFKLVWEKLGIASGSIDYINIFSEIVEVDETSETTQKNKSVSNYLAKQWTDHIDVKIGSATPHNIDAVDETSTDTTKTKLVSNNQAKVWTAKANIYIEEIDTALWVASGPNYTRTINHNLEQRYVVVDVYNTATEVSSTIVEKQIIDDNNIRVTVTGNTTQTVVIIG